MRPTTALSILFFFPFIVACEAEIDTPSAARSICSGAETKDFPGDAVQVSAGNTSDIRSCRAEILFAQENDRSDAEPRGDKFLRFEISAYETLEEVRAMRAVQEPSEDEENEEEEDDEPEVSPFDVDADTEVTLRICDRHGVCCPAFTVGSGDVGTNRKVVLNGLDLGGREPMLRIVVARHSRHWRGRVMLEDFELERDYDRSHLTDACQETAW